MGPGIDAAPSTTVSFLDPTSMADHDSGLITVPVVINKVPANPVTVHATVTGGTALQNTDYTFSDQTLTFDSLEPQYVQIMMDQVAFQDQDVTVVLALDDLKGDAILTGMSHTITISHNTLPRVAFGMGSQSVQEAAGTVQISVVLDKASPIDVHVQYQADGSASTAIEGSDFTFATAGSNSVTIPAGMTSATLPLTIIDDAINEGNEVVALTILESDVAVPGVPNVDDVTIVDNDPQPTFAWGSGSASVPESVGAVEIPVVLSAASGLPITIPIVIAGGSATAGSDYNLVTTTVTIPAGQTSAQVEVDVIDDTIDEDDETALFGFGSATNATPGTPAQFALTIVDNDLACFGPGSGSADVYEVCLERGPTTDVTLPATLSTDAADALCEPAQPAGWLGQGQVAACVIEGTTITVPATGTVVTGGRPLVLVSSGTVEVTGLLDASGTQGAAGPGAPSASCKPFSSQPGKNGSGPGGGGAGGSFMLSGGTGGTGDQGSTAGGGASGADVANPTVLRAGCDGQAGGNGNKLGGGGGAVYVIGATGIDFTGAGAIDVSGGGAPTVNNPHGGGGGGSGGMLKLVSPAIAYGSVHLLANGGGGGAGGGNSGTAGAGGDPDETNVGAQAPGGVATNGGGVGGVGGTQSGIAQNGGNGANNDGGGGAGGGAGYFEATTLPASDLNVSFGASAQK
jgi:hypothetical protein